MEKYQKQLLTATLGDLVEVLKPYFCHMTEDVGKRENDKAGRFVYGVKGLAKLCGCSQSTAQRRLSSGILDHCVIRTGRLLVIDAEAALVALNNNY